MGVYLFFDFMKHMIITSLIATVISLVPIVINLLGYNLARGEARFHVERTTLANVNQGDFAKVCYAINIICDMLYTMVFMGSLVHY